MALPGGSALELEALAITESEQLAGSSSGNGAPGLLAARLVPGLRSSAAIDLSHSEADSNVGNRCSSHRMPATSVTRVTHFGFRRSMAKFPVIVGSSRVMMKQCGGAPPSRTES